MEKIIIAAVAENNVIGKDGDIPWHIPEDLQHFKEKTTGNTVVMGRKTFQSLPSDFKPLPDRENIVLTRSNFKPEDESVKIANSLDDAWEKAENEQVFIAGGGAVYRHTMAEADRIVLTKVKEEYDGDTHFPEIPESFDEISREEHEEVDFIEYER